VCEREENSLIPITNEDKVICVQKREKVKESKQSKSSLSELREGQVIEKILNKIFISCKFIIQLKSSPRD
jgi:predicted nucleic acid-binding protein